MSYGPDDLAPLFGQQPSPGVAFRQGLIVAWDPLTAANTVDVAGATLTDLPVLNTSEVRTLAPGDVVGVLTMGAAWFILGRITVPGSPAAATAPTVGTYSATIETYEATSTTTWHNLATIGPVLPNVLVGPSGRCLVYITSTITMLGAAGGGEMAYEISGATTVPTGDNPPSLGFYGPVGSGLTATRLVLQTDLTPGLHTFTARYVSEMAAGGTARFGDRNLTVVTM